MPPRSLWLRRVVIAVLVAGGIAVVPYHLYGGSGLSRLIKLRAEVRELRRGNAELYRALNVVSIRVPPRKAAIRSATSFNRRSRAVFRQDCAAAATAGSPSVPLRIQQSAAIRSWKRRSSWISS